MLALRQKASPFTKEEWQNFLQEGDGLDPVKAQAFRQLESLRQSSTMLLGDDFDWKQELQEAIDEKYTASQLPTVTDLYY